MSDIFQKTIIKKLYEYDCILFGDFVLKSGIRSTYYLNLRNIIAYPKLLKQIANLVYEKHIKNMHQKYLENSEGLSICGLPYAGIPLASYISSMYDIPLIILRKEKKEYGTKKMLEGINQDTKNIILIDDIITSGLSIYESLPYFNDYNICNIITVIDREQEKIYNIKYKSLFKII